MFVSGFDKYKGEDQIRNRLEEHFGSCREITRVSIPKAEDGSVKSMAYKDATVFNQAGRGHGHGMFEDSGKVGCGNFNRPCMATPGTGPFLRVSVHSFFVLVVNCLVE